MNIKSDYCMGRECKCEVCGKRFIPTPEWVYRSATSHRLVCSYNCRCKTEKEKTSRYNNIISRDIRR
jgi:hypothetical protein